MKEHFKKDLELLNKIENWIQRAHNYEDVVTPFLNPYQINVVKHFCNNEQLSVFPFSFIEGSERQKAIITISEQAPSHDDYNMTLYKCTYKNDWFKIKHKDVMGAVLATGIKFDVLGDIFVDENEFYVEIAKNMEQYIQTNMPLIGKAKINYIKYNQVIKKIENTKKEFHHLSSLRIDNLVSSIFNLSRNDSKDLILSGDVYYDFCKVTDFSMICDDVDKILSVKGHGRVKIVDIKGHDSERYLIMAKKYI